MAGSVFILKYIGDVKRFAESFFASTDFEMATLKNIAHSIGVRQTARSKSDLITLLTRKMDFNNLDRSSSLIIEQLVARPKETISVKIGNIIKFPICDNPNVLITEDGQEKWYGPVKNPSDDKEALWYIRPQFIDYWDTAENEEAPRKFKARWLCFARLTSKSLSLHWRGFTYPNGPEAVENNARRTQFAYWQYVPQLFLEFEKLIDTKLEYVNLHNIMLYYLWDKFLDDEEYVWTHTRIRAESGGVSLNAHAGNTSDKDLNVGGILKLATTIRKAMENELLARHNFVLSQPDHFDNAILRTLIREFGALSYGFSLQRWGGVIFKAHSYFGLKPNSQSSDSFPHMLVVYMDREVIEQLKFILLHAEDMVQVENLEPRTIPMF